MRSRCWAIALVVPVLAALWAARAVGQVEKEIRIEGKLTAEDPKDRIRNAASKVHLVRMKGGLSYTIDMVSTAFDSYLRLEDPKGKELAEDDDSGGMLNARIVFSCPKDGEYKVICTAFNENGVGAYVLTVKKTGVAVKLNNPHTQMVGKPAPDFAGAFALNGKAVKLSDLKGKVVALNFWAVWNPGSVATLPRLGALDKAHKEAGLEVVGLSFYNYENGQFIGFDKENGKLTKLAGADAASEQATLKEFAEHHKLKHLLMVLHKEEALKTFNEYYVNGFPQVALIDRQGNVRNILVGERAINDSLEAEVKKLLAEK